MNYPKVTQTQLDLWLKDPVTKTLCQCLEWHQDDVKDELSSGSCVDESNADLTLSKISRRRGQIEGLITASDFGAVLDRYKMVGEDSYV